MKYIRRFLWFVATRLFVVCIIASLVTVAFYLSMNTSNIYILIQEGMQKRAEVILRSPDQASTLTNYFRREFLDGDEALRVGLSPSESPYADYKITGFEHDLRMEWMWSWPWEQVAEAVVVERIPKIEGSVIAEKKDLVTQGVLSQSPPPWEGGKYTVRLHRMGGQWKIVSMTQTQRIVEPPPAPTQAPTPTPAAE